MEAKELRIGNLTECYINGELKNKFHVVDADDIKIFLNNDWYVLKPIPLTEEILLRFGFGKVVSHNSKLYAFDGFSVDANESYCTICYKDIEITKIKFVHSLQNLYFSIKLKDLLCDNI